MLGLTKFLQMKVNFLKLVESLEVRLHRPWVLAYPTSVIEEILYVEVYIMGYIPESPCTLNSRPVPITIPCCFHILLSLPLKQC